MNVIAIKEFAFDYILEQDNLSRSKKLLLGTYVNESDQYQVMHLLLFGNMVPSMTEEMNDDVEKVFYFLCETDWEKVGVDTSVAVGKQIEKGVDVAKTAGKFIAKKAGEKAVKSSYTPGEGIDALKRLARSWASFKVPSGTWKIGPFNITVPKVFNQQWHEQYVKANAALHAGAALAAAAVVVMIFMAAKKAYKATLTKAARSCKRYEGLEKNECIRKFHVEAIKKDIQVMTQNRKSCEAARKPGKCLTKVDKRIKQQKDKLQKALTIKKPKKL